MEPQLNFVDRLIMLFAPQWGLKRVRARVLARHFDAASSGRRTSGWSRRGTDANSAANGATLLYLRAQARDLVRNNPWARRGLKRIVSNVVGWGIRPKATGKGAKRVMDLWKLWGETTDCDSGGKLTFYAMQAQVMRTIVESGEVIIRRRMRQPKDGLAVPMQLQVLEPDYIDTSKDGPIQGGKIVQGVEFNLIGQRVAYWLFDQHPGGSSGTASPVSKRIPADGVLHVYVQERPGQVRGTSWFASVDVRLHDFDEYEDATLMKQKIAACLAAFVTDSDGSGAPLGEEGEDKKTGQPIDTMEPGMILNLAAGRTVTVANPPAANDHQSFSQVTLRAVAAGLGVTYEDLTGDYSQVNFSSARMARIAHMADVNDWRWNTLIPTFCAPVWEWMLEALQLAGDNVDLSPATWTPPALAMIDPNTESTAITRQVRAGQMTPDEMVREQGYDPDDFWAEYASSLKRLDKLGLVLDSDPRRTTTSGQLQSAPGAAASPSASDANQPADTPAADGSGGGAVPAADQADVAA